MAVGLAPGVDEILDDLAHRAGVTGALALGGGSWLVPRALLARGVGLEVAEGIWPAVQLPRRFPVVMIEPGSGPTPEQRVAVLHCGVQHGLPGAHVVSWFEPLGGPADADGLAERFHLTPVARLEMEGRPLCVHRRTERFTVHDLVFQARETIRRVSAAELAEWLASDRPPMVLDTRTPTDRLRHGVIPGALHVPRSVLEWHLDPANGYRHPAIGSFDQPLVVVCNGGYSSSLAAANLAVLGFTDVADLIGGHHAWLAAGLPVVDADHSHLDV